MSITEYMKKHSLTYRAFAEKCEISPSMIYRIEVGERGKSISLPIAQAIIKGSNGEITIDDLLDALKNGPKLTKGPNKGKKVKKTKVSA